MSFLHRLLYCIVFCLLPLPALAVNFAAGAKVLPGYQLSLYPYLYSADIRNNKDGNPAVRELGLKKYAVAVGNAYYFNDFMLNMIVPLGGMEVNKFKSRDSGVGDIQLRAGWFAPIKEVTLLPLIMLKVPSGNFDKGRTANFGDGQADLSTELYLHKIWGALSLDTMVRYTVRFRNPDTDQTPGNEFYTELLTTWQFADRLRIGPAVNFVIGDDNKRAGQVLAGSGLMKLAVGGELYFGQFSRVKMSLAGYQDILAHNTNQGFLLINRLVFPF